MWKHACRARFFGGFSFSIIEKNCAEYWYLLLVLSSSSSAPLLPRNMNGPCLPNNLWNIDAIKSLFLSPPHFFLPSSQDFILFLSPSRHSRPSIHLFCLYMVALWTNGSVFLESQSRAGYIVGLFQSIGVCGGMGNRGR